MTRQDTCYRKRHNTTQQGSKRRDSTGLERTVSPSQHRTFTQAGWNIVGQGRIQPCTTRQEKKVNNRARQAWIGQDRTGNYKQEETEQE